MSEFPFNRRECLKLTTVGVIGSTGLAQAATAEDHSNSDNNIKTASYDWESGTKEGWERIGVNDGNPYRYGYSRHVFEFNIINDNPISGSYSPQIECLNDGVYVQSPDLSEEDGKGVQRVSATFRLEGDLDASDFNSNRFRVNDKQQNRNGYVRFDHEYMEFQWRGAESKTLQPFNEGQEYQIAIEVDGDSFVVVIDGQEYSNLQPFEGQDATIHTVEMRSQNWGGTWSTVYDDSIYFTWDNFVAKDKADFDIDINSAPETVTAGDDIQIELAVTNTRDIPDEQTIELDLEPLGSDSVNIALDGLGSTTETLSVPTTSGDAGDYSATVSSADTSDSQTIEVLSEARVEIEIIDQPASTVAGESVNIFVRAKNTGSSATQQTIEFEVESLRSDTTTVSLDGGESTTETLSIPTTTDDIGEYIASVTSNDDSESISLEIVESTLTPEFKYTPTGPTAGEEIQFDATESQARGSEITQYKWDFSEDETIDATGEQVVHTFPEGSHQTELTIVDEYENEKSIQQIIDVSSKSVSINITASNTMVEVGDTAHVTYSISNYLTSNDLEVQLLITTPSDVDVTSVDGADEGSNQFTAVTTLSPATHENIQINLNVSEPGEHEILATADYYYEDDPTDDNRVSESLVIEAQEAASSSDSDEESTGSEENENGYDEEDDAIPGVGVEGALASLGGVAYLLKRRMNIQSEQQTQDDSTR